MPTPVVYLLEDVHQYRNGLRLYTVRREGAGLSEYADFAARLDALADADPGVDEELGRFWAALERIDARRIPLQRADLLRPERAARALPPQRRALIRLGQDPDIRVRLYCYPLGDRTLILFNGDRKTDGVDLAEDCPRVSPHFHHAIRLTHALDEANIGRAFDPVTGIITLDPPEVWC